MTSSPMLPGCLVDALVRGFFEQGEPVGMLPRGRLAPTIKPIVSGAARAAKGRNDLRGSVTGNVVSECHPRKVSHKNKSAMPKIILAQSRQCRHIEPMKTFQLTLTEDQASIIGFALMGKIRELTDLKDEISKDQLRRAREACELLDTCPEKEAI